MPLSTTYNPKEFETNIYATWVENGLGSPEIQAKKQLIDWETATSFATLMPPPNLTGGLHAGHAFQHYIMDTLTRIARQQGETALWYPGVDHAGIQLEGVIDKLIKAGEFDSIISERMPHHLDREEWPQYLKENERQLWLECAWSKVNLWRGNQRNQSEILGDSPDYDRSLFTLDDRANRLVYYAFQKYWEDGLVYKGEYMINWSVGLQTALSDFQQDVEWIEQKDPFITFQYRLQGILINEDIIQNSEKLIIEECVNSKLQNLEISTVRPETIFADVAIAIHPNKLLEMVNDSKLAELILQSIENGSLEIFFQIPPLGVHDIKLVVSDKVEFGFGSSTLKITPSHDEFDFKLYQEFAQKGVLNMPFESAIGRDGRLTPLTGAFAGYKTLVGRMVVIKRLLETDYVPLKPESNLEKDADEELEYISDEEFAKLNYQEQIKFLRNVFPNHEVDWDYKHNVLYCERSKTPIEPLISSEFFLSYYNKSKSQGRSLQEIGMDGIAQTRFFPAELQGRAEGILENVHDWCISRQLIWGHRIPVWYNEDLNPSHQFYQLEDMDKQISITVDGVISKVLGRELMTVSVEKPTTPGNWVQETKVFDTWFSSCLWPLTTLNYFDEINGEKNTDFQKFYPTNVMVTGIDIFYAWIVRMILLCNYWTGKTPFQDLVINPTVLDEKGKKMSKSLGNGLNPEEAIAKYSSDALRLGILSGMIPGRNMRLGGQIADNLCEKYRNFGNKLWNVARFLENKEMQKLD